MFDHVSPGYWSDISNQRKYFAWLARTLHIQDPSHWLKVRVQDVVKHGNDKQSTPF
jgi:hypothetical protein